MNNSTLLYFVLNGTLLVILGRFFIRRYVNQDKSVFIAFLILKIICGLGIGMLYKYYYSGGDTFVYFDQSALLLDFLATHHLKDWSTIFQIEHLAQYSEYVMFSHQPRAMFFSKLIVPVVWMCGRSYWLTSIWLSSFACAIIWVCYRMSLVYIRKKILLIGFLFWPGLVFWASGVLKESIVMPLYYLLIAVSFKMFHQKHFFKRDILLFLVCGAIIWYLKYYYAALLIPILISVYVYTKLPLQKSLVTKFPKLTWLVIFVLMLIGISFLHPNLHASNIWAVLSRNYFTFKEISHENSFIDLSLDKSIFHIIIVPFEAFWAGLYRPLIWESWNFLSFVYACENMVLLVLSIVVVWILIDNIKKVTVSVVTFSFVILVVMSAILLTIASPNLGSLSRYVISYKPVFMVLLLSALSHFRYFGNRL